jgi:hypothetical protein
MSKQAQRAVEKIAELLGSIGPAFLRMDGKEAERIIDTELGTGAVDSGTRYDDMEMGYRQTHNH